MPDLDRLDPGTRAVIAAHYRTLPIDAATRDGRFHLLLAGDEIAIARLARDGRWELAPGRTLPAEPDAWLVPDLSTAGDAR